MRVSLQKLVKPQRLAQSFRTLTKSSASSSSFSQRFNGFVHLLAPSSQRLHISHKLLLAFGFVSSATLMMSNQSTLFSKQRSVEEEAEELYNDGKTIEIIKLLRQHISVSPNDYWAHWRLARALHDTLLQLENGPKRKELAYLAYDHAKKALELNPDNFATHKWVGITLSTIGDYETIKDKIANSFIIKDHFVKATELNLKDATSFHLIGLWCNTFADMPWYTAKVAAAIFTTPPTSTYDEALSYFLKAEEIDPGFYKKNQFMIAFTYYKMGKKEEAKSWVNKCLALPVKTEEDKIAQQDAEKLKSKL